MSMSINPIMMRERVNIRNIKKAGVILNFLYMKKKRRPVMSSTMKYLGEIGFLQNLHLPFKIM